MNEPSTCRSGLCYTDCLTLIRAKCRNLYCPLQFGTFFLQCSILLFQTTRKQCYPKRTHDCASLLPSPVVAGIIYHVDCFTTSCFSTQRRVSVLSKPHLALNHTPNPWLSTCFWQSSQKERGASSVSKSFLPPLPSLNSTLPKSHPLFFFESEQTLHSLCLPPPPLNSVQDRSTPGPVFTPEAKYTVDLLHHSSAFHSPWYFCRFSHLSTRPCSHTAPFPPSCPASFWLD